MHTCGEPSQAVREGPTHLLALDFVGLEADSLFKAFELFIICPVINLYLFIEVGCLTQPVVWHFTSNRRWLTLITTTDDLNTSLVKPVQEHLQNGARNGAVLVPDDDTGDALLSYAVWCPVVLATPSEEAV